MSGMLGADEPLSHISDEDGATAVEYAIMAALIAVAIAGTVAAVGDAVVDLFGDPGLLNALTP